MSLIKRDKERQLIELTQIVTGIRLFNKECGKGGEGIDDLPAILNEAVPATTQNVDGAIQKACGIAFKYTGERYFWGVLIVPSIYQVSDGIEHIMYYQIVIGIHGVLEERVVHINMSLRQFKLYASTMSEPV